MENKDLACQLPVDILYFLVYLIFYEIGYRFIAWANYRFVIVLP